MRFNFASNNLTIFPAVTNYLHTSPGRACYFFPYIGEVKQIHTHKGPSDKSVLFHKAAFVKSIALFIPINL
jgi:hypothetical protein